MKDLETAVNKWYQEWLKANDPFEEDFDSELYQAFPSIIFSHDPHNYTYSIIGDR